MGAAVGATVGVIAVLGMVVAAVVFVRRKSGSAGAGTMLQQQQTSSTAVAAAAIPANNFVASLLERAGQLIDRHCPLCTETEGVGTVVVGYKRIRIVNRKEAVAQGAFGPFCNGVLKPQPKGAAIPGMVLVLPSVDSPSTVTMLAQALLCWRMSHQHILRTKAVAHKGPHFLVMFESCKSSLRELLKAAKQTKALLPERVQRTLCEEVASGMQHLESVRVVHGALSPECIYVATSDGAGWTAKVGFGAEMGPARRLPLDPRRASPEDMAAQSVTSKGDVFSFGVVAWEIFAFGATPYSSLRPEAIGAYLAKNSRLPKPKALPELEFEILQECWMMKPGARPTFEKLSAFYTLLQLGNEDVIRAMQMAKRVPEEDKLAAAAQPPPLGSDLCSDAMAASSQWNLPRHQLHIFQKLGEGNFGDVFLAVFNATPTSNIMVALKTLRGPLEANDTGSAMRPRLSSSTYSSYTSAGPAASGGGGDTPASIASELEFKKEADTMKRLNHPNLVSLLGVCIEKTPLIMVMEYLPGGALCDWLVKNKASGMMTARKEIGILAQVASGMHHLSALSIVHRDLAARNVLVGRNLLCKVVSLKSHAENLARGH